MKSKFILIVLLSLSSFLFSQDWTAVNHFTTNYYSPGDPNVIYPKKVETTINLNTSLIIKKEDLQTNYYKIIDVLTTEKGYKTAGYVNDVVFICKDILNQEKYLVKWRREDYYDNSPTSISITYIRPNSNKIKIYLN